MQIQLRQAKTAGENNLRYRVIECHDRAIENLKAHFGAEFCSQLNKEFNIFAPLKVTLCGRLKRSLGNAYTFKANNQNRHRDELKIHRKFYIENNDMECLFDTYSHELAHILVERLYKTRQNHNWKWSKLHQAMGGNGKQFHNQDVKKYARPYQYSCYCDGKKHNVSGKKHNLIQRNGYIYKCRTCRNTIQFEGKL